MPKNITIIGNGKMGGALRIALTSAGHAVERVVVRCEASGADQSGWGDDFTITSDVVLIAVSDAAIADVVQKLRSKLGGSSPCVFHVSGSVSSEVLEPLREAGCLIGSMHPLVSVSTPELGATRFAGAYFCLEGDRQAVVLAAGFVDELGGHAFAIPTESKSLYHTAAVTACGHIVALVDIAIEMLAGCGIERDAAKDALFPLIASTVANLEQQETEEALTGPYRRADGVTVEAHIAALQKLGSENASRVYLELAERSIGIAARAGADAAPLDTIRQRILLAKSNFK